MSEDVSPRESPKRGLALVGLVPLVALAGIALAHGIRGEIDDFDELWHLASGRVIVETGSVPLRDPFTHTAGETPWVNTNWLAQVVLWTAHRIGGIELDWLLGLVLLLGATALAHVRAARRASSPWATVPVTFFVLVSLMTGSTVRPQGWSFLLLPAGLLLADLVLESKGTRKTFVLGGALGVLLALAIQLHGAFFFVFLAVGLVLAGELWDLACKDERASGPGAVALGLALAVGLGLGTLVHPHGSEALLHPLRYASPEFREINEMVQELRPPDFATLDGQVVEGAILAILALALVGRAPLRAQDVLVLLVFSHLAWTKSRGLHYFAVAVAGPLACGISGALVPRGPVPLRAALLLLGRLEPIARTFARFGPWALEVAFAVSFCVSIPRLSPGKPGDTSSPRLAPHADIAEVASYLATWNPPGEIWNEPEQGGALIFRLYPNRKVFIDGRGDLHARSGAWHSYANVWDVRGDWEAELVRQGCDVAVVTKTREGFPPSRIFEALLESNWPVIYQNQTVALLVRPGSRAERSLARR